MGQEEGCWGWEQLRQLGEEEGVGRQLQEQEQEQQPQELRA